MEKELINKSIEIAKENKGNINAQLLHLKLIQSGFKVGRIKCNRIIDELQEQSFISENINS